MLINKNLKKVLIVGALSLLVVSCGGDKNKENKKVPRLVRYQMVDSKKSSVDREFTGSIYSENEAELAFRVGGTLIKKNVKLGNYVKKGDILARLDDTDYVIAKNSAVAQFKASQGRVLEAKAQLNKANVSFSNSQKELDRIEKLYYDNNVSKKDYDNASANRDLSKAQITLAKAGVLSAESSLEGVRSKLNQSKVNLSYTKLVAPKDGYISQEDKAVNELVSPGTPIYTLGSKDDMKVNITVSENLISKIKVGESVEIKVGALGNKKFKGHITEVSSGSISGAGYPIQIKFDSNYNELITGMTVSVKLEVENENAAGIYVPLTAVSQDEHNNNYVYVVRNIKDGVGMAEKVDVKLGNISNDSIHVSGVKDGEYIITAGVTQILDKELVRIPEGVK